MDWNEVTVQDLLDNVREVDWGKPKPLGDFFGRFSLPNSADKWTARLKANFHYYRCNYLIICLACYLAFFLRNPLALMGVLLVAVAVLCTNDSFATTLNDNLLRLVRRVHPSTALKIRARTLHTPSPLSGTSSRRRGGGVYILSISRVTFVAGCIATAGLLLRLSAAWRTLVLGTALGIGFPLFHASFRSPNLKAKLSNARDEFKARWKTYQADMMAGGLGLGSGVSFSSPAKGMGVDYSR